MFEVGGEYRNRKGNYTVLTMDGDMMSVRFEDGSEATLKMAIQHRIWENIVAEQVAAEAASAKKKSRARRPASTAGHYIKAISIPLGEEMVFPGWEERVVLVNDPKQAKAMKSGDRLIFYALEAGVFIAVATLTGESFRANPAKYTFVLTKKRADFFHLDIDTAAGRLEHGVPLDSIELESLPEFGRPAPIAEALLAINEDDFELLAEAITEISEEEDEDDDEDIDDDDDEDEDE